MRSINLFRLFVAVFTLSKAGSVIAMEGEPKRIALPQAFFSAVIKPVEGENFEIDLSPEYSDAEIKAGTNLLRDLLALFPEENGDAYSIAAIKNFFEEQFSKSDYTPLWVALDIMARFNQLFDESSIKQMLNLTTIHVVLTELKDTIQTAQSDNAFLKNGVYGLFDAIQLEKSVISYWENLQGLDQDTRKFFIYIHKYAFDIFPLWVLNFLNKHPVALDLSEFIKDGTFFVPSPTAEYLDKFGFQRFINYQVTCSSLDVRALHGISLSVQDIPIIKRPLSGLQRRLDVATVDLSRARVSSVSLADIEFLRKVFPKLKQISFCRGIVKISHDVLRALHGLDVNLPGVATIDTAAMPQNARLQLRDVVVESNSQGIFLLRKQERLPRLLTIASLTRAFAGIFHRILPVRSLFSFRTVGLVCLAAYGINRYLSSKRRIGTDPQFISS